MPKKSLRSSAPPLRSMRCGNSCRIITTTISHKSAIPKPRERNLLYSALDAEWLAEIISYLDDPAEYIDEIGIDKLAEILNEMDADDAVDLWENIDESVKVKLRPMIDDETKSAILLINSYDDSEVGSLITTNYICIKQNLTIRQAMHELVKQAGENDNIGTIYVVDDKTASAVQST